MKLIPYCRTAALCMTGILLLVQCENRMPVSQDEPSLPSGYSIYLDVDAEEEIIATVDTVPVVLGLIDSNNNIIRDHLEYTLKSARGLLIPPGGTSGQTGYVYFYPYPVSESIQDTLTAAFVLPGGADTLSRSLAVTIRPRTGSVGYLPAHVNLEVRTDTVVKAGADWKMLVDATVTDSLGNPVKGAFPVYFTFIDNGIDTSLVSLRNKALTGDSLCLEEVCSSQEGAAVSILSFDSKAISRPVIIKGMVEYDRSIGDYETIELPLPVYGLKLAAHNRDGGPVIFAPGKSDTAPVLVTLHDAFNVPVPGRRINVTPSTGRVQPNCPYYGADSTIIGSMPCTCDTVFIDSCREEVESGTTTRINFLCDTSWTFSNCDPLVNPYSVITDTQGEAMLHLVFSADDFTGSEDEITMEITVELEETLTHVKNSDFILTGVVKKR